MSTVATSSVCLAKSGIRSGSSNSHMTCRRPCNCSRKATVCMRHDRNRAGSARIDPEEFRARPLRVHALLQDVPPEDAWAVPLAGGGAGRTDQDLRAVMIAGRAAAPAVVRGLFWLRFRIGALFGWDHQRSAWNSESYADRLSVADRARSLIAPRDAGRKLSPLVSVRGRAAERAAQRDGTCLRVALDPADTGRLPGLPGGLRAARAWVHQAVHESNRAVSPSGRLPGHHSNNAACVGRTLWSRERDREPADGIAGVTRGPSVVVFGVVNRANCCATERRLAWSIGSVSNRGGSHRRV